MEQLELPLPIEYRIFKNPNELKNCPFCGGEPELMSHRTWDSPRRWQWCVRCIECKTYTVRKSGIDAKETVIRRWNARVFETKANLRKRKIDEYDSDELS